jgi:hypothetical protein
LTEALPDLRIVLEHITTAGVALSWRKPNALVACHSESFACSIAIARIFSIVSSVYFESYCHDRSPVAAVEPIDCTALFSSLGNHMRQHHVKDCRTLCT